MNAEDARAWVRRFEERTRRHRDELTDLDRRCGDGDFGTNACAALARAVARLDDAADPFAVLSDAFLNTGGTSGPLFGVWFRGFAGAWSTVELAAGAERGLASVRRFGGADVGDKTMVDAIAPAVAALRAAAEQDKGLADALRDAARAARSGALATAGLTARRGRASYVGAAGEGVMDPGALAVALFFESAGAD